MAGIVGKVATIAAAVFALGGTPLAVVDQAVLIAYVAVVPFTVAA